MVYLDCGAGIIEIWVECAGKRLAEFSLKVSDDGNAGGKEQEGWIASEEDQEFSIHAKVVGLNLFQHRVDIWLDGVWMAAKTLSERSYTPAVLDGMFVSPTEKRAFLFGRLTLQEDDGSGPDTKLLNALGTIKVQTQAVTTVPTQFTGASVKGLPGDQPVSEKAKKAGAHAVKLGGTRQTTQNTWSKSTAVPGYPVSSCTFRYAPLEMLYAREIIARPPGYGPSTSSRPGPSTSASSSTLASSSTASSSTTRVKAEKGLSTSTPSGSGVKVKEEKSRTTSGTKRKSDPQEVIDLSSDTEDYVPKLGDGVGMDVDDDDEVDEALDPEERELWKKMKGKIAARRTSSGGSGASGSGSGSARKKVKTEVVAKREKYNFKAGDVIELSD